jgi:ABC-2 type transport system ATP-binding protein
VEAVCDRVAVLREGVLVEEGTLDELRHLHANSVEARFSGDPPSLEGLPGARDVQVTDGVVRLQYVGSPDALLKALARTEITALQMREPSLEELFHAYYAHPPIQRHERAPRRVPRGQS